MRGEAVASGPVGGLERPAAQALRRGLPYGAVMATGGAAQLGEACNLTCVVGPLLWLALAEAVWIVGRGLVRHRHELGLPLSAWLRLGVPNEHTGVLTVPLGLAVVAAGLRTQPGAAEALGAALCLLAWLSAAVFVARFIVSFAHWPRTGNIDGSWFLAPAVVLGIAVAAAAYAGQAEGALGEVLRWAALVAAGLGVAGYWAVVATGVPKVARRGLGGGPKVLWWIAAGCGGLAAVALRHALFTGGARWPVSVVAVGRVMAVATWSVAAVLAVPIVVVSVLSLLRSHRVERAAPWPPAFSSAVFALGTLATGHITGVLAVVVIGKLTGAATLALWGVTAALHVPSPCRPTWPSSPGHGPH